MIPDAEIVQAIRNFKSMSSAIETVYLIEASPTLRAAQHKLLCGDAPLKETDIGHESTSKYSNLKIVWSEDIRLVPKGIAISFLPTEVHRALTKPRRLQNALHRSSRVLRRPAHPHLRKCRTPSTH